MVDRRAKLVAGEKSDEQLNLQTPGICLMLSDKEFFSVKALVCGYSLSYSDRYPLTCILQRNVEDF